VKYVETFNSRDPYASDPTHSYLSKDHFVSLIFRLLLRLLKMVLDCRTSFVSQIFWPRSMLLFTHAHLVNEPAGNIAKIIVVRSFAVLGVCKVMTTDTSEDPHSQGRCERLGES
jgi:hypothetical protein